MPSVAPVASAADDDGAVAVGFERHLVDGVDQCLDGIRVVAVVGDQRRASIVEEVEAAWRRCGIVNKAGETGVNDVPVKPERPAGAECSHRVLDLEADRAVGGDRYPRERDAVRKTALAGDDGVAVEIDDALAEGAMRGHDRMMNVAGEESDLSGARIGHAGDHRVGGIEHGDTGVRLDVLHDHALDDRQVLDRADVGETEVVALADVGDDGDVAAVEAEALAQHAAARGFEHGRVDVRVHQDVARALRAAAIAGVDALALDVDAVGAGHADAVAVASEDAGDEANRGRLAVGTGDGDERDARVVAFLEHVADDRFADRAAFAERGLQVHAQAGRGVQFDDAAVLLFERTQDVAADDIDAGDVEADGPCRGNRLRGKLGMHVVGDVRRRTAGR